MPALAFIDRLDTLSFTEKLGVIRSMTRKARVLFKDQPAKADGVGFTILSDALAVCPAAFSTLAQEGYGSLVLVERNPQLTDQDPKVVDVTLQYEHILDGPNQKLYQPDKGIIYGKGSCSITQKKTNFYYPMGDKTKPKRLIVVGHTYPPSDTGAIGRTAYPELPNLVIQGGEVEVSFPQGNFQVTGYRQTDDPWATAKQFISTVNKIIWMEEPARTWICSEVQWEIINVEQKIYRFSMEFQNNSDGWDPDVVFNDSQTGKPPPGLEKATVTDKYGVTRHSLYQYNVNDPAGLELTSNTIPDLDLADGTPDPVRVVPAGIWTVPSLREVDFDELFAAIFEGDLPPNMG